MRISDWSSDVCSSDLDLGTDYGGSEARWRYRGGDAERPWSIVAGLSYDDLRQHRQGYENFIGTDLGVRGAQRRDEIDTVYSFDQYLQGSWRFAERRSEEHTSELQSLMRISYAVFCLKKKK